MKKPGYRECTHCGSNNTVRVAHVEETNGAGAVLLYWVRWECRECHRSSETRLPLTGRVAA